MLMLVGLMACGDKVASVSSTGGGGLSAGAPTLRACDAWCYLHQTGDAYYQWLVSCDAEDPQGPLNLDDGSAWLPNTQGVEQRIFPMVCDEEGLCHTSFREDTSGVSCADAPDYSFQVQIWDLDGNGSAVLTVKGRREL